MRVHLNDDFLPFVSVIMPVRNEQNYIAHAIQSILDNDYPIDKMEIIIVDGMSDDATRDIVQNISSKDNRVRLVDNPNKIVPFAMNIGLRQIRGDIFIRVDGHAEVAPDFIKKSIDELRKNKEAWVVGGYIENVADGYVGNAIASAMKSPVGVGNAMFRLGDYEGWVDTLAFGTHHKWVLDKIGYFDEELVRNQDDDFNARIIQAGGKIWMSQAIRSKYYTRNSLKKLWRQYFQYGFWRIRTIQKHKKPASIRQMIPLIFVLSFMLLAIGGCIWKPMGYLWLAEIVLYGLGLLLGALDVARKSNLKYAILSPVIFIILHFAYGLGSMWGILRFVVLKGKGLKRPNEFKLSR